MITLKNQDDLKNEDGLKNEDDLKNEDNLKTEDNLKNYENLKNEDVLKLQLFILSYLNQALGNSYRTKIWLSKFITGQEFGSQISLPDILPKLNTFDISLVLF